MNRNNYLFSMLLVFLNLVVKFFAFIPWKVVYVFSDILYFFFFYVIRYRRKVTLDNLLKCFPNKNLQELKKIEHRFYRHFIDLLFEFFKSSTNSKKNVKNRYIFKNLEPVQQHLDNKQSVIVAMGHYGNWENILQTVPVYFDEKVLAAYKKLSNKIIEKFINNIRIAYAGKKGKMVEMDQILRQMFQYKDEPYIKLMGFDQKPLPSKVGIAVKFLNRKTGFFSGVESLSKKFQMPLFYLWVDKIKRGHYECSFVEIYDGKSKCKKNEVMYNLIKKLEQNIEHNPAYWLWSHNRWKEPVTQEIYE